MIALSTAFHIDNHTTWESLRGETLRMGYRAIELNVKVPAAWLSAIERSVATGEIAVSSVHNYCPRIEKLPAGRTVYSGYLLTSADPEERRLAIELTLQSIHVAQRMNAKVVVMHMGQVETTPTGHELFRYVQQFGAKGALKESLAVPFWQDRARKAPQAMELLHRALDVLLPTAQKAGVILGLENRYYTHELPNTAETVALLNTFAGAPMGYWHDTGHAETFARMGWVANHLDTIAPLKDHLVGYHMHDMKKLQDHFAPGSGDFDFDILKPFIKEGQCVVVEAHGKSTAQEVERSLSFLTEKGYT